MHQRGSGLLILILAIVVVLIACAFLFMRPSAGPVTPGMANKGPQITPSACYARVPGGVSATVTITNSGTKDLRNVRVTKISVHGLAGGSAAPILLGRLAEGASTTFTLPFTGTQPSPGSSMHLQIDYDFEFGWRGSGGGTSGVTSVLP
jgi:hypothetical protein